VGPRSLVDLDLGRSLSDDGRGSEGNPLACQVELVADGRPFPVDTLPRRLSFGTQYGLRVRRWGRAAAGWIRNPPVVR